MTLPWDKAEFVRESETCARCGFICPHVEAAGMWCCPNCGPSKPAEGGKVTYDFGRGCKLCGKAGHQPRPGYMEPMPRGHPRVVFGLAPEQEDDDVRGLA